MSKYSRPDPVYIFDALTGEKKMAPTTDPVENERREKVEANKKAKEKKDKKKKK